MNFQKTFNENALRIARLEAELSKMRHKSHALAAENAELRRLLARHKYLLTPTPEPKETNPDD